MAHTSGNSPASRTASREVARSVPMQTIRSTPASTARATASSGVGPRPSNCRWQWASIQATRAAGAAPVTLRAGGTGPDPAPASSRSASIPRRPPPATAGPPGCRPTRGGARLEHLRPRRQRRRGRRSRNERRRPPARRPLRRASRRSVGLARGSRGRDVLRLGGEGTPGRSDRERAPRLVDEPAPHHRPGTRECVLRRGLRLAARAARPARSRDHALAAPRLPGRRTPAASAARCGQRHDADRR